MFVGIMKDDVIPVSPTNNFSCQWSGSYGWVLRSNGGGVFENGLCTIDCTSMQLPKQGDTVELVLDCDAGKLSLHLSTGYQFYVAIPKFKTWRLRITEMTKCAL
jgi:hypothetical protein